MKKLIKYPDEIHKALQHLAIDANMDRSNYNQTKAIEILSNCVAKNRLIQTLKENEQQIIQLLESWKSW
jgi:hypothetical protein